ncbi:unnamed protein product [Blepharisma stoltei]|uniref:WD repeat domain phosphoinositide-interacting protein 3 n=1 Tax=Blepharisma stoltei TaxID=1481888 RepID=A0AAU9IXL1_9CILI|nr:unnamed protein product [Blepharisma stoltei]
MVTQNPNQADELIYTGFNQDYSCFTLGTDSGFRIFNTYPLKYCFRRDFPGGFGIVELLYRSNIVALVGGGKSPRYPPNKVIIWDDHQMRPTGELCFRTEVKGVKLRRDRAVVLLENKIYVYSMQDLKIRDHILTAPNPKGVCALSSDNDRIILATPDREKGKIRISNYTEDRLIQITAHETSIACLGMNPQGTILASASDKGTTIKVYNIDDGSLMQELRRGIDRASIYCLSFHPSSLWLACSSDKGTIHIYSISQQNSANPRSAFSFMKSILPKYFDSECSFAQLRIKDSKSICTFGREPNTLIVINSDGNYCVAEFNPEEGGACNIIDQQQIMDLDIV